MFGIEGGCLFDSGLVAAMSLPEDFSSMAARKRIQRSLRGRPAARGAQLAQDGF
jgi:hypothetical protein